MGPPYADGGAKAEEGALVSLHAEKFDGGRSNAVWDIVSGDETWVYCFHPETKQQSQQWIPIGQRPPQKFLRSRTVAKQMIAMFVRRAGHVATIPLVTQSTVTSAWYTT